MLKGSELATRRWRAKDTRGVNLPPIGSEPTHPLNTRMAIGFAGFFVIDTDSV